MMILDDAYHVISGGFGDGKQFYTPTEVSFLSGTALSGYDYQKCYIMGGNLVLLIVTPEQGAAYFAELMDQAEKIYLLLIPLYIAAFAAFLYWVSRKIRHPLEKLNEAIGNFSIGDEVKTGQLEGPLEISQLGRTFDRMAEELAESERKRNEMDMARKKMMADISHDLKTPITVISGYIRAITDGKIPPEEQGAYLEMIDKRSRRLVTLIDSFHELSKVEHPDFTLKKERLDGFEYMRSYLADRYNEILFHKFDLDVDIPEEEEQHVPIDTLQLRRALDNVLYNSLRHNPPGTILTVKVSSVQEEGACWIRISIGDNGLGIPPEKRDHIFEPFIQGDDARSGGGSGLGLAISRSIIEAHGGRISLCSRDGSPFSTEFEILLPAAEK